MSRSYPETASARYPSEIFGYGLGPVDHKLTFTTLRREYRNTNHDKGRIRLRVMAK